VQKNAYLVAYLGGGCLGLLLFFVTARYRVILVPVLAIYGVLGFRDVAAAVRRKSSSAIILAVSLALLFGLANIDLLSPQYALHGPVYMAQAPFTLGRVNLEENRPAQALEWLAKSVAIDPLYPDAWVDIGRAQYALGRTPAAIEAMEHAITVAPDYPLPYFNLALIYDQPSLPKDKALHYYELFAAKSESYFDTQIRGTQRLQMAEQKITEYTKRLGDE